MLIRSLLITVLILSSIAGWTQKKNQPRGVPLIFEDYEFASVFKLDGTEYVLINTFDLGTHAFLKTNPKRNEIYLPGLGSGNEQKCSYNQELITYVTYDNITQAASFTIDCLAPGGYSEKRNIRIHYIRQNGSIDYVFSLDVPGSTDKTLYHSFNDQKLNDLILGRVIRF